MNSEIVKILRSGTAMALKTLYDHDVKTDDVNTSITRKDFEGDFSIVVFPYVKVAKKKPEAVANEIGEFLRDNLKVVKDFNVVKGFVNLIVVDDYWKEFVDEHYESNTYGQLAPKDEKVMVEFSSPNTNKPLHLGHIRNNLLGWSVCKILQRAGYEVVKANLVNDRGIHICKSMLAWQKFGDGETPESTGIKGDHIVGKYYVEFDKHFKAEFKEYDEKTDEFLDKNKYFNEQSKLGKEVKEMLLKWEEADPEIRALWKKMNTWVLDGHNETYDKLGIEFDKFYFESFTYSLGKDIIEQGVEKKVFYKLIDNSVWIDLEDMNLDKKLVLRSDGTSVYMTQDIGTARLKHEDFGIDKSVYVVADEQNYHFQVLFEILKRLEEPYADGLHHLSYGMVNLPSGRMKSREGTVVDADDLIEEVIAEAKKGAEEKGGIEGIPAEEKDEIVRRIGLGALKYFLLKVNPKKSMIFNPEESVDFQGQTGPFIQYAYVRANSIFRKFESELTDASYDNIKEQERDLIIAVNEFPSIVDSAARNYDPSEVANYCYDLAKKFHKFIHDLSILRAESEGAKVFRIKLSMFVSNVLEQGMDLLGIQMPERM